MFLASHTTSVHFMDLVCSSCMAAGFEQPTKLTVDGPEYGLLRQTETQACEEALSLPHTLAPTALCFGEPSACPGSAVPLCYVDLSSAYSSRCSLLLHLHNKLTCPLCSVGLELLYQWRDKLKHCPTSMHELWRHHVQCQFGTAIHLQRLWFNRREGVGSAFLDFMQLQRLDMEGAFWCEHMQVRSAWGWDGCGTRVAGCRLHTAADLHSSGMAQQAGCRDAAALYADCSRARYAS